MTKPLFVARLAGTQPEMGAQHGRLVADDARELVAFYRTMPERALVGDVGGRLAPVAKVAARALATAWQANLARTRPSELDARARAFAAATGARTPVARWTMATMDSLQNCVSLVARTGVGPFANMTPVPDAPLPVGASMAASVAASAAPMCTSVIAWGAATADGELRFARNFDFPGVGVWDAAPAFVINAPTGGQRYGFFARRGADTAVVTVVNEAGLVIAPHTRWHLDAAWSGAMIVDLVHEIARKAESLDDAVRIARGMPASSTWGIAVGSARERSALVLEIAGPRVEVVRPDPGASYLVCANRYRTASLQERQVAASPAWAKHSDRRYRRMRQLVEMRSSPLTPEMLARFLADRCDVDAPGTTRHFGGVIAQPTNVHCAVITPAKLHALVGVDAAPTCEGSWADLTWTWDGPVGGWEIDAAAPAGFTVTLRDDITAQHDAATKFVHIAARAYEGAHDVAATRAALESAILAAPDDPSLRQAAAWIALEQGDRAAAVAHIDAGLALETDPFRREQMTTWRAASRRPHVNLMMADAY